MNKENWEKEFRKRFNNERTQLYEYSQKLGTYNSCGNSVELFISEKLQQERERIIEMIENMKIEPEPQAEGTDVDDTMRTINNTLSDVVNKIKTLK